LSIHSKTVQSRASIAPHSSSVFEKKKQSAQVWASSPVEILSKSIDFKLVKDEMCGLEIASFQFTVNGDEFQINLCGAI
jgi:hypothetical protein